MSDPLAIRLTGYVPHKPHPRQHAFLALNCPEAFYGGAGGGGKSDALLMAALQYVDVPGYAAILFRQTYADLERPGALMDRSKLWLGGTDAHWSEQRKRWTFPSGAKMEFGYLQNSQDRENYRSAEFQFCVARGTPVLMADGEWRPIEGVRIGDAVQTLEGPRRVYRTHRPGVKPCVRVTTPMGSAVVSTSHRLLTPFGWASPSELHAIRSRVDGTRLGGSRELRPAPAQLGECSSADLPPTLACARQVLAVAERSAIGASPIDARSDCGASDGSRRVEPPPREWFVPLVLHVPDPRSAAPAIALGSPRRGLDRGCSASAAPGCSAGSQLYQPGRDERSPQASAGDPVDTPSPSDAAGRDRSHWPVDDLARTPSHSRWHAELLVHPYTSAAMDVVEDARLAWAQMAPAGAREVLDLSVEGAAHYIVQGGMVASNCGFDELTQFLEGDYRFLHSRIRRPADGPLSQVPLRMRSASNPGGRGHVWVRGRFIKKERSDLDDSLGSDPSERIFIPAKLSDNPSLDQVGYTRQLMHLDPQTRRQILDGDWNAREPGACFQEFNWDRHTIDGTRAPNSTFEVFHGIDFGLHHAPCLWIEVYGNSAFVFAEHDERLTNTHAMAESIIQLDREFGVEGCESYIDPAGLGAAYQTGKTDADVLMEHGIQVGNLDTTERYGPEQRVSLIKHLFSKDRLFISRDCPYLIEALERAMWARIGGTGALKDTYAKDGLWEHPLDALGEALIRIFRASAAASAGTIPGQFTAQQFVYTGSEFG